MRMIKCAWYNADGKLRIDFSYSFVNNPGHIIELRPREVQYFYSFKHKTNPNIFRPTE